MFTKEFWILSAERAAKTFAQALVTIVSADQVAGFFDASILEALASAGFATLLSFLTSIASTKTGDNASPSLVPGTQEEVVVKKIEAGEPVGDPARHIDPEAVGAVDSEPVGEL